MKHKIKFSNKQLSALMIVFNLAKEAIENDLMPVNKESGEKLLDKEAAEKACVCAYQVLRPAMAKVAQIDVQKIEVAKDAKTGEINVVNGDKIPPEVLEVLTAIIGSQQKKQAEASPEPETQEGNA
ncbi:hypothetical protein [Neisseria shayeganii]|uniref:Uncharacterized protein n=1 Tax=Neisseria shayeganii TaxID=607712 RepID=A0A7D7NCR1_9NEIS|nr:hypothetical protein [Neisseria shayeganii]QMT41276.1 hypothetical protein H3L94_04415 [Neisseria shayeganii]